MCILINENFENKNCLKNLFQNNNCSPYADMRQKKSIIQRKQFLTKKISQSLCVTSSLQDIPSGDCPISPWSLFPNRSGFHYFGPIPPSIPLD
jgi:hypothetical protein